MTLYDYIYVDFEKVVSLYSQLTGGVIELREINKEQAYWEDNKRKYDLKIFRLEAGGTGEDKSTSKSVMKPHHSVLTELEEELTRRGYLVDLTDMSKDQSLREDSLRKAHPVVPGSPICGMRMPRGGRLRRAREGIEWLRAIGVSTVPRAPKGRRTATGMPTSGSRHPKLENPAPFQISLATPIC